MTTPIDLSDEAYDRLAQLEGEDESFSDVVRRLTGAPLLRRLAGTMDEATAEHYRNVIREARRRQDEQRDQRVDRLIDADRSDGGPP